MSASYKFVNLLFRKLNNNPITTRHRINQQIRTPKLRVIDETGQQLGVMDTAEALRLAQERGFDLMEVAAKTNPPVARLVDYGKYLYQQSKLERKKHQKKSEVKGVRIKPKTSKHDLETKINQIQKFLNQGHKVRIEMFLRGRERALKNYAKEKFNEFLSLLKDYKTEEKIKTMSSGFAVTITKSKQLKK